MDLSAMTLDAFLNESPQALSQDGPLILPGMLAEIYAEMMGPKIGNLSGEYALHQLGRDHGDVALLHNGIIIGVYHGTTLMIEEGHCGKQLSVALILEAVARRSNPEPRELTNAGRRALTRAWEVANCFAENPWPRL